MPLQAPVVRPPNYYLYDAAVAGGRVYALAGFCTGRCGYRLLTWDGARWASTRMTVPASSVSPGRLLITGRYLTVLDGTRPGAYVSRDGGRTFTVRTGRTGDPVAAVPTGLVADLGDGGVGVFDPVAGEWHPLRTQPLPHARSVVTVGRTLYAVDRQGTGLVVASSIDAGRSWRRTTVVTVPYRTPELALVAGADGSAYLVVTRTLPAGEPGVVQVWRSAGRSWTRLVDYSHSISSTPRFTTAVGEPNGGILHGRRIGRRPGRLRHRPVGQLPAAREARSATRRWSRPCCAAAAARSPRSPRTAVTCWSGTTTRPPGRFCRCRTERTARARLTSTHGRAGRAQQRPGHPAAAPAAGWSPGSCSRWPSAIPALLDTVRGPGPPPPAAPTPVATIEAPQVIQPIVVSVAAGSHWAYALVAECGTRILHDCDYRVFRRDLIDSGLGTDADALRRPDDHRPGRDHAGHAGRRRAAGGRHRHAGLRRRRRHRTQPPPEHRAPGGRAAAQRRTRLRSCARPAPTG